MEVAKTVDVDKREAKAQATAPTFTERVKKIRTILRGKSGSTESTSDANLGPLFAWYDGDNWADGFKNDHSWQKNGTWDNYDTHYKDKVKQA